MINPRVASAASLSLAISRSLQLGELSSTFEDALLAPNHSELRQRHETELWDYKEQIDLANPVAVGKLAKVVLAFHNAKGGAIIIGVDDDHIVCGIPQTAIVDTVRLRNKLRQYVGEIPLFQHSIPTSREGRPIWVIFVPRNKGVPVATARNGPDVDGAPLFHKDAYFIRISDEVRRCIAPSDFERLFSGIAFDHLHAYVYEIDEPSYRLLSPHQDRFVGRVGVLQELREAMDSRSYIVTLDGVGGVGKSAVAIQFVRELYDARKVDFIISISAKNRVWQGHTAARQAGFTGLTELVRECATVLQIEKVSNDIDELKQYVIAEMDGKRGLLFVDNIESIEDDGVFEFLRDSIPEPVKVLVTSKISRAIPARPVFVPEMTDDEAHELLIHELKLVGYHRYVEEAEEISEIVNASGRLPLTLKWAAGLADQYQSLRQVSARLRGCDTAKKELLAFCFTTMFDGMSLTAQQVATLCPFLGDRWNAATVALALDETEEDVRTAIVELQNKGILIPGMTAAQDSFSVLPLTMDFLSAMWHRQIQTFGADVKRRLANAIGRGNWLEGEVADRVKMTHARAVKHENEGELPKARQMLRVALSQCNDPVSSNVDLARVRFAEGRIICKLGNTREGIVRMKAALDEARRNRRRSAADELFLGSTLLSLGQTQELDEALRLIAEGMDADEVDEKTIEAACSESIASGKYDVLARIVKNSVQRPTLSYIVARTIKNQLWNIQVVRTIGPPVVAVLEKALTSPDASNEEREWIAERVDALRGAFAMRS